MTTFTWPLTVTPVTPTTHTISAVNQARRDMMLLTSENDALTVIGQNYGVPRPPLLSNDDIYRRCVQVLAWQPKTILFTTHALLEAIFGSQSQIVADGKRPWRVYEVNANEIVIEMPQDLISFSNEEASYLHGWDGYAYNNSGVASATFTTEGDVRTVMSSNLVGHSLLAYIGNTWNTYQITAVTYTSTTNTTSITLNAAVIPQGGTLFHVLPAGDNTASYRGDYVAPSGHVATFHTNPGVGTTNTIYLWGDYQSELALDMTITLLYNGTPHAAVITSSPNYVGQVGPGVGDYTSFDVDIAVPEGLTAGVLLRSLEVADTSSTTGHEDRVYLTGDGLYEVFIYYFNLLVRAAGIVVRMERI